MVEKDGTVVGMLTDEDLLGRAGLAAAPLGGRELDGATLQDEIARLGGSAAAGSQM